jgi:triacylglycerol esterase/lipase EstA (alpha/beta hydrolase family)
LVFIVLLCAIGLWLALELLLTTISFVLVAILGRKERARREPLNLARAVVGYVAECGAAAITHFLVTVSEPLAPHKKTVALHVGTTPILLVPGYFSNRACFLVFVKLLRRFGGSHTYTVDPKPMTADIRDLARQVAEKVDAILSATRASRVNLVGHSMGGLIARYYVERLGGARKVNVCVTIGTPHHGSLLSRLALGTNAKQMRPGSEFLRDLNKFEHIGTETKLVSIWSIFDNMTVPPTTSVLGGRAKNISLDYIGHLSMLYSPNVARLVWENLNQ